MRIGEVAQRTGLSISNIRFYEKKGLIGPDRNAQNRYREYGEEDVRRLEEIILYRKMDFTIETIADLLEHKTDVQQAMEAQIDQLEEQKQKLQGSIDLCRKIVSDQAYENLDVAYYMNYVKAEEADGKKFADIGALLEDFSECTGLEPLLNDMGRYRLFADHRVKSVARIVWFVYLLAFPVVEIGLTCVGVCEWSAARVIFFGFWLAMLVSTFVEYRKEKG